MPARVPISAAREVAKQFGLRQVILVAWDGSKSHVVTFGQTVEECDQAAQGGNIVKKALGFPDIMCNVDTSRVARLKKELEEAKKRAEKYYRICEENHMLGPLFSKADDTIGVKKKDLACPECGCMEIQASVYKSGPNLRGTCLNCDHTFSLVSQEAQA